MRRRDFIMLFGGAAVAWPLAVRAQQPERVRRIGVLMNNVPTELLYKSLIDTFVTTLQALGWRDGQNLRLDIRWSEGDPERIRSYAEELVAMAPDLLVSSSTANLQALLRATRTIPIVFLQVSDPVAQGLVSNLAHPGGNITGFTAFELPMGAKWLDLLKQMAPSLKRIAVMFNPDTSPQSKLYLRSIEAAAPSFGVQTLAATVHHADEIEKSLTSLAREPNGGLLLPTDTFTLIHEDLIVAMTARHGLPAISASPSYASKGGLMSYSVEFGPQFRQAAIYANSILKGALPGEMPIQLATNFKLIVNLKTARALGIDVPMGLMLRADEMIE
jgi:putative ABC transport system substrate-binding protein